MRPNAGLQDVPFVVTVSELPAHWDEVDVEQAMARLLGVAWGGKVMVERQDMQLGDPSGQGCTCDHLTYKRKFSGQLRLEVGTLFNGWTSRGWACLLDPLHAGGLGGIRGQTQ